MHVLMPVKQHQSPPKYCDLGHCEHSLLRTVWIVPAARAVLTAAAQALDVMSAWAAAIAKSDDLTCKNAEVTEAQASVSSGRSKSAETLICG